MARIWPVDPAVPSRAILGMHDQVVALADDLFREARGVADHRLMALAEDLFAWSVTLERMAVSSPRYHGALGRSFPDHPLYGKGLDDRLIPHRAQADLLAFVGIGDLVLNDLGRLWMRQLGRPIPASTEGFGALLEAVDGEDVASIAPDVRQLQVSLRSARNRLLAHVRPDHGQIRTWASDDTPHITLVGLADPADVKRAVTALHSELVEPLHDELLARPRDYIEVVASRSWKLTSPELWALDRAMRVVGYVSLPISSVVDSVLRLGRALRPVAGGFNLDPRDLVDE